MRERRKQGGRDIISTKVFKYMHFGMRVYIFIFIYLFTDKQRAKGKYLIEVKA